MKDSPSEAPPAPSGDSKQTTHGLLRIRLVASGLILLLEYLVISYAFDAQTVKQRGGIWTLLGETGRIGPLVVVAATALFLSPGAKRRRLFENATIPRLSPALIAVHVGFAVAFMIVTALAFGNEVPPGPALLWMLVWAALGAGVPASLFGALLADWSWLSQALIKALALGGLLGLIAWAAGSLSTALWEPLSYATFVTVGGLLQVAGFELRADEAARILELEGFAIDVAPVCSGFEGIGLFFVLMIGFLYQFREVLRFPRALLLLPVGMIAVWYGNAIRIAALMIVGARLDAGVAIGSFHSKAGWVFFCAITLLVAVLGKRLRFFSKVETSTAASLAKGKSGNDPPTAAIKEENFVEAFLVPLLCWMGLGLLSSSFSEGHDPFYPLRVAVTGLVIFYYRRSLHAFVERPGLWAWLVGAVVGVVWLLAPEFSSNKILASSHLEPGSDPGFGFLWIITRALGAVLIVPICEELAFRGFLARRVSNGDFWKVPFNKLSVAGVLISSVAFGVLHGQWLLAFATGVIYALLVRRSGKLIDGIAAHAMSNLVIAIWVIATSAFEHW